MELHDLVRSFGQFAVASEIARLVAQRRLERLVQDMSGSSRPAPYGSEQLSALPLDEHGLVDLNTFRRNQNGYQVGHHVYELLPSLEQTNSVHWVNQALNKLGPSARIRIRLDPFMEQPEEGYSSMHYAMRVYGPPLTWDRVLGLEEEVHHKWMPDPGFQEDVQWTDAVWTPRDRELHFTCEEVPKPESARHRGSRYFHTIIDRDSGTVIHADGAIRIYSPSDVADRAQVQVREAGKVGTRVKIFRVDGEVPAPTWSALVKAFFVWNQDIGRFVDSLAGERLEM